MSVEEILLEVATKYNELASLTRRLIATKISDTATVSALQVELNSKNQEISTLLQSQESTKSIATQLSGSITSLIEEATAALPGDVVAPVEPPV